MLVEIGVDAEDVLVAIVIVAIFQPAEHIVGEGIVQTRADRIAVERGAVLAGAGRFDETARGCPAGGTIEQGTVCLLYTSPSPRD